MIVISTDAVVVKERSVIVSFIDICYCDKVIFWGQIEPFFRQLQIEIYPAPKLGVRLTFTSSKISVTAIFFSF